MKVKKRVGGLIIIGQLISSMPAAGCTLQLATYGDLVLALRVVVPLQWANLPYADQG